MLGWLEWRWLGVFIASNHQFNRWGTLLSMGAPDSPVRQPRHPTVRVLTVSTVGAFVFMWHRIGTVHYLVRLLAAAMTLRELSAHYSTFAGVRCSRPLCWSRCPAGAPDSPMAHRTVR
jgi:hypothetical protein